THYIGKRPNSWVSLVLVVVGRVQYRYRRVAGSLDASMCKWWSSLRMKSGGRS
ncbi:hypothetical protein COCVIDRAFT_95270, partial [Bipolaris victoriae FI3]